METQLYESIKKVFATFALAGFSGNRTIRYVDEDVFINALDKILEEKKCTENPV